MDRTLWQDPSTRHLSWFDACAELGLVGVSVCRELRAVVKAAVLSALREQSALRGAMLTRSTAAAIGALAVALLSAGCTIRVDGNAVAAADLGRYPAPVAVSALEALLPSAAALDAALRVEGMTVEDSSHSGISGQTASDDCAAIWNVAWRPMYAGSGWIAIRNQFVQTHDRLMRVWQAVAAFPLPVDATAFHRKQAAAWRTCEHRRLEMRFLDEPASRDGFFNIGAAQDHQGVLFQSSTQANDTTWACEHALSTANNVIVDVQVCGERLTGQAESLTRAIAAKVPVS